MPLYGSQDNDVAMKIMQVMMPLIVDAMKGFEEAAMEMAEGHAQEWIAFKPGSVPITKYSGKITFDEEKMKALKALALEKIKEKETADAHDRMEQFVWQVLRQSPHAAN